MVLIMACLDRKLASCEKEYEEYSTSQDPVKIHSKLHYVVTHICESLLPSDVGQAHSPLSCFLEIFSFLSLARSPWPHSEVYQRATCFRYTNGSIFS